MSNTIPKDRQKHYDCKTHPLDMEYLGDNIWKCKECKYIFEMDQYTKYLWTIDWLKLNRHLWKCTTDDPSETS